MIVFAVIAMLAVGGTLGLMGSGGSVLSVPILVYCLGLGMAQATGYSLLLVGLTSLWGAWANWRRRMVSLRISGWFGVPSLISVYATRAWLVPRLPVRVEELLMLGFAALMIAVGLAMLRHRGPDSDSTGSDCRCPALMAEGLVIGVIAGLLGAGGGFLIVPALVLLGGLPMNLAVGTSLTIVAVQSLVGFAGAYHGGIDVDWPVLAAMTAAAIIGMIVGLRLSRRFPAYQLRAAFGWFLLLVGAGIATRELLYSSH